MSTFATFSSVFALVGHPYQKLLWMPCLLSENGLCHMETPSFFIEFSSKLQDSQ
jgi:hypothetical protein